MVHLLNTSISYTVQMNEKSKIFYNIWCNAYQRRTIYKGTDREHREHETVRMCLDMKDVKFYQFDTERPHYLG
jgi:hypothetical protein